MPRSKQTDAGHASAGDLRRQLAEARRTIAELRAEKACEELDNLFTHNLDLLCIADSDGRFRRLNPEWERVLGYPLDELQGARFLDFVHPDDVATTLEGMAALARQEPVLGLVNRYRARDGSYRLLEWRAHSVGTLTYNVARDITQQRRAEAALRESEERFRTMADSAPVMIWLSGPDQRTVWVNRRLLEFAGFSSAQEFDAGWLGLAHPQDATWCIRAYREAFEARAPFSTAFRIRRADGSYRWLLDQGVPRFDAAGAFLGYIGSGIDITGQKDLQEELTRLTREQRVVLDNTSVGIALVRDVVVVWANRKLAEMLGSPQGALASQSIRASFPSQAVYDRFTEEAGAGRVDFRLETEMMRADGSCFWASIQGKAIDAADPAAGSIFIVEDVSARREAERRLRASEEKYAALFRLLPVGVSITDDRGALVEANPASERILGLTRSEHLDRMFDAPIWRIVRPDGSIMPVEEYASVRAQRENRLVEDVEMGVERPDGELSWILVSSIPIPVEGHGVAIVYKDITERKLAEGVIRASLREKETLLREIHHRVKNNMQVVSSLLELQSQRIVDAELKSVFAVAQRRVKTMALLHERLYGSMDFAGVDFGDYLEALARETLASHGIGGSRIALRIAAHGIRLRLDTAVPCALVVSELLTNCLKHAFPGSRAGVVEIELKERTGRYQLVVRDDGVGLPQGTDVGQRPTLGLQLVGVLVRQLRGSFELSCPGGVVAEMFFPRDEVAR